MFNWFFFVETHFAGKSSPSAPGALGIGPVPPPCRGQMLADPGHAWYRWGQPAPAAPDRPWHRGGGLPTAGSIACPRREREGRAAVRPVGTKKTKFGIKI